MLNHSYRSVWALSAIVVGTVSLSALAAEVSPSAGPAKIPAVAGQVVSVEGMAFVRADGKDTSAAPAAAKTGDFVKEGDLINTSSNGRIKVLMKDKSIIDVGPSALFKIDEFKANGGGDRQVQASMMYGTVRAAIAQKLQGKGSFKIRTPSATMGVRGTEFVVKSDLDPEAGEHPDNGKHLGQAPKTEITVLQGKVDVAQNSGDKGASGFGRTDSPKVLSLTAGNQLTMLSPGEAAGRGVASVGDAGNGGGSAKVVTLDTKSMSSLSSSTKTDDHTFSSNVTVDASSEKGAGKSGDSPSNAGQATLLAVASAVHDTPVVITSADLPPPIKPNLDGIKINQTIGTRKLRVIVIAP